MSEYIGNRIVPAHGGVWNSAKTYEPLVIVYEEGTGDSYISRKDVPAGTGLGQKDYWALCARFSEQMEIYQEGVDAAVADMQQSVEDCEDLTNSNKTVLNSRMDTLESRLDANVAASTDSDADYAAEVVDARVDELGNSYDSLGSAVRGIAERITEDGLRRFRMTASVAEKDYGCLLENLPCNTYCWVGAAWFTDRPEEVTGSYWIYTMGTDYYKIQIVNREGQEFYRRMSYDEDTGETSWADWRETFVQLSDYEAETARFPRNGATLSNGSDLDDISTNSIYIINSEYSYENCPVSSGYLVTYIAGATSTGVRIQLAYAFTTGIQYYRRYSNSSWKDWIEASVPASSFEAAVENGLKYKYVGKSAAADEYGSLLSSLDYNTYSWVGSGWFTDQPEEVTGSYWIFTYGTESFAIQTVSWGGREFYRKFNYSTGEWGAWGEFYALAADLETVAERSMHYLSVSESVMEESYSCLLGNLPQQSLVYISTEWVEDGPPVSGIYWVATYSSNSSDLESRFAMQTAYKVGSTFNHAYHRVRRAGTTYGWGNWYAAPAADSSGMYYAFGDSTTKGQIAEVGGTSPYNYPACVSAKLGIPYTNKGVGGQGLLKDWDTIHEDFIDGLDMDDARLVTVAWAYNDASYYSGYDFGSYTDTSDETVIGKYYTIMKEFQEKCPDAMVILITGFGSWSQSEPFEHSRTFQDGTHTIRELYDELEKMCHYNGWNCINQANGTWVNKINHGTLLPDNVHGTSEAYKIYGNFIAGKIAGMFGNAAMDY